MVFQKGDSTCYVKSAPNLLNINSGELQLVNSQSLEQE